MQLFSLNLLVLMLAASCTGAGIRLRADGDSDGEGEKKEDIPMAEAVAEATPVKTSKEVLEEVVQELRLKRNFIRQLKKKSPKDLIIWATEKKITSLVDALLKEGVNPNTLKPGSGIKGKGGSKGRMRMRVESMTILMIAAGQGDEETVKLLLENGADPNIKNDFKKTALSFAVIDFEEHYQVVETLIAYGATPNVIDKHGVSALTRACGLGHLSTVKFLLKNGADPNIQQGKLRLTPLMNAAELGKLKVVKALLEHGANPGLKDHKGKTAVDYASRGAHIDIVRLLNQES